MNTVVGIVGGLVVGAALGVGVATLYKGGNLGSFGSLGGGGGSSASSSPDTPLFELDGAKFAEKDLPADTRAQLHDARTESHERINQLLTQFALQKSLAKEKGKDVAGAPLPPFEELLDIPTPPEEEMKALYEQNKARLPPNTTYEQIKGDIERYVKNQKMSETLRAKNDEFKEKNRLKLLAAAPVAPQVTIDVTPYPAKGPAAAPHTLVAVADYLCPHCQASAAEVETMAKEMGDKLKLVPVTFSLKPEGLSGSLARGAFCARQQSEDAFWKYHEAAFRTARAKGWKATDPDAKEPVVEVATAAAIDVPKVEACIATPEAQAYVQKTVDAMHGVGVTATPTFFLNGRRVQTLGKSLKEAVAAAITAT